MRASDTRSQGPRARDFQPRVARLRGRPRRARRGMTLIEMLVAMTILAFLSVLIYQAMDGLRRSREGIERVTDRYREGRLAMARITRELQSAYLSEHAPIDPSLRVVKTSFIGEPDSPISVLSFNSFAHRRLRADARESDQVEISYFGSEDPAQNGVIDLARRVSTRPDDEPEEGGRVEVLATDVDLFELEYLDPLSGKWREEWDSTSVVGEKGRLPVQVKITLVLNGGKRRDDDSGRGKIRLVTKVQLPIRDVLDFAIK